MGKLPSRDWLFRTYSPQPRLVALAFLPDQGQFRVYEGTRSNKIFVASDLTAEGTVDAHGGCEVEISGRRQRIVLEVTGGIYYAKYRWFAGVCMERLQIEPFYGTTALDGRFIVTGAALKLEDLL